MKTLICMLFLIGAAIAIPDDGIIRDNLKKKAYYQDKSNSMEDVQSILASRKTKGVERTSSESNQDQSDNRQDGIAEYNDQGYSVQKQNQNNSEYWNSKLDTLSLHSLELREFPDPTESPTVSINISPSVSESHNGLSKLDLDKESEEDNGRSNGDHDKESEEDNGRSKGNRDMDSKEVHNMMHRQESQGPQGQEFGKFVEQEGKKIVPLIESDDDDEDDLGEDENGTGIRKGQTATSDKYSQNSEQVEDSISSDTAMEESSQIPQIVNQKKYAHSQESQESQERIQDRQDNIAGATLEGQMVNRSFTETRYNKNTVPKSQEDNNSNRSDRKMEDGAKGRRLYKAVFLENREVANEDRSSAESRENITFPGMTDDYIGSEEEAVFQSNKTLDSESRERFNVEDYLEEKIEGDGGLDSNETEEDRVLSTRMHSNVRKYIQEAANAISLDLRNESASESIEHETSFGSLKYGEGILSTHDLNETIADPCQNFRCKRGKICEADEEAKPKCVCQNITSCPQTIVYDQVCGTDNKTYESECHLFGTKCQLEGTKKGNRLHLDYRGSCKYIPPCSEYELVQFPLRMRDWLKNVLVQLYENDLDVSGFLTEKQRNKVKKIYQHEKRLMNSNHTLDLLLRDFEKNNRMYVYPVHWQFSQLDHYPVDRRLSHSELAPLRAPLIPMEHCITEFFKGCNTNKDKYVSLKEWGLCFGIKEEDIRESLLF